MARKRRVTAQDIADIVGVSKATVSYALNGTGSVSDEMTEKIVRYADKLGYRTNRLAAATRTGTTYTVGLVVPDLSNPLFPELAQAVHKAAHERGYAVFLVDSNQSLAMEFEGIERLIDYRVDGVLWAPIKDESVEKLDFRIPIVVMDRDIRGFTSVFADTRRGGQLQARYVQDMGHHRIGIISGPTYSPHAMLRNSGVHEELDAATEVIWEFEHDYGHELSEAQVRTILDSDVSCVITGNDIFAIELMRRLRRAGKRIPEDVSIIGFDDIGWAELITPSLTTIKLPKRSIGERSLELLCDLLEKPDHSTDKIVLDVSLVERESVRRV